MSTPLSPTFIKESRKVLRQLAADILKHEPLLFDPDNVEAIHEARVSVNKLRVALKLLQDAAPKKLSRQMQSDLKWFKDGLAPVRDEDVIQELLAELGDPPYERNRPGIDAIAEALRQERAAHLEDLRALGETDRYLALKSNLEALQKKTRPRSKKEAATDEDADAALLEQNLAELLHPLQAKFEDLRRDLAETFDPPVMHQWRISAKKFRYALDFFKDLNPQVYKPLSKSLHDLHNCTGKMHDIDVLAPKVESLAAHWQITRPAEENERLATGIEWVLFRLYQKRRELMREFYAIWARIASEEFRARAMAAAGAENVVMEDL